MKNKERMSKYILGVSLVLKNLSKEIDKYGLDKENVNLIKKIGSDMLFKGVSTDIVESIKNNNDVICVKDGGKK